MKKLLSISSALFLACSLSACSSVGVKDGVSVISSEPNVEVEAFTEKTESLKLGDNFQDTEVLTENNRIALNYPQSNDNVRVKSIMTENILVSLKMEDPPEKVIESTKVQFKDGSEIEYVQTLKDIKSPTYTVKVTRFSEDGKKEAMFEIVTFKNKLNTFGMTDAREVYRDTMNVFFVLKDVKDKEVLLDLYVNEHFITGFTNIKSADMEINLPNTKNNVFFLKDNKFNLNDILVFENNSIKENEKKYSWQITVKENVIK